MNVSIFFIVIGVLSIIYILYNLKKGALAINDSIFWMFGTVCILVLAIFPGIVVYFANIFGIEYPPSLLFLLGIIILFCFELKNVKRSSEQSIKIIALAQEVEILKEENKIKNKD